MNDEHAGDAPDWMQEQAAEYQDLVGSFVESVVDSDTDEILEYQLIWEGGDLGVALTTLEGADGGVAVSRVTGKGFPFGIKNVGPGDLLLAINMKDTTKMTLDDVVAYLQVCDLPATLRFKKLSPVTDSAPVSVPRKSTYVITSENTGPTSPMGSHAPPSYPRGSQRGSTKYTPPPPSHPDRASMPVHKTPSEFPEPPPAPQRQSAKVPTTKTMMESPPKPASKSVPKPAKASTPSPEPVAQFDEEPVQEYNSAPTPVGEEEEPKSADAAPTSVLGSPHKMPKPPSPRQSVAPEEKLRELDGLVLTSGVNDLGFEDSESERDSRDSWRDQSFDVDANVNWKGDEEEKEAEKPSKTEQAKLRFTREKSNSTVPMLGHFSVETKPDAVPILPEVEEATGIAAIDNVNDFSPVDHHKSPGGEAGRVRPSDMSAAPSSMVSSLNSSMNTDAPRGSVRVTMDSTAPIMKSHPIGTLHEMCAKGNLRGVIQHLRVDGPEALLNREPNHGQTGLHLAVKSGKVPLVKVILEQYKPVEDIINVEDDKGNTALHFAATKTPAMVHLLLESGASANVKNSRKYTPLIISVITSRDDKVIIPRMLLKFGANPNDMHDSQTVIHTAIGNGLLQIAGALVRAGAKMDVEDADGKNVFEKLNRKSLRVLISHIYFPPTHITEKERTECMLCHTKFKFGHRKHNCTHCGRLCCAECSALTVEMVKFPMGFPGRTRRGAANRDQKRVCKTCYNVFKEREDKPEEHNMSRFINRVINIEWDEVNPEKLQAVQDASRRGEK
ncbi:hypothetical protein PHYBOEH_000943 [Phytophthora boehmeriae]|uniref:Myosin-like protein n=1 Tax=Phytophthora boehmeriae TaxID=109152 RepID=A0A8T1WYH9_9STRA|nr:hypothetical protein PHYBOEH_000943 [Phytophthora boehmeriae]